MSTRFVPTPPWHRLGERTQTMLQRLNASVLLHEADLIALVWPEPVSRQAQEEALKRWQAYRYIQVVRDGTERCYQLDLVGAKVLRNAGVPRVAPSRLFMPRVRTGVVLTNHIGTQIVVAAQRDPRVTGVAWVSEPFSGSTARPDGSAAIQYLEGTLPMHRGSLAPWRAEVLRTTYVPPVGEEVEHLAIEVDRGTESQRQLGERARQWRMRWEAMPEAWAARTTVLWVTTGTEERLNRIWEAWIRHAFLPAFFAVGGEPVAARWEWSDLLWEPRWVGDWRGRWRNGYWRDLYGRPRLLQPWLGHEPVWRCEALEPVRLPSLTASIAAWDRAHPG